MDIFTIQEEAYKRGYEAGVKSVTDNNVGGKMSPTDKDINVLTNADRIRAMSDAELAEFLCGVYDDDTCGVYQCESGKFINGITILDYDEFKILEWLKQPSEVDNG